MERRGANATIRHSRPSRDRQFSGAAAGTSSPSPQTNQARGGRGRLHWTASGEISDVPARQARCRLRRLGQVMKRAGLGVSLEDRRAARNGCAARSRRLALPWSQQSIWRSMAHWYTAGRIDMVNLLPPWLVASIGTRCWRVPADRRCARAMPVSAGTSNGAATDPRQLSDGATDGLSSGAVCHSCCRAGSLGRTPAADREASSTVAPVGAGRQAARTSEAPANACQAPAGKSVLKQPAIGVGDNFFQVGGGSNPPDQMRMWRARQGLPLPLRSRVQPPEHPQTGAPAGRSGGVRRMRPQSAPQGAGPLL